MADDISIIPAFFGESCVEVTYKDEHCGIVLSPAPLLTAKPNWQTVQNSQNLSWTLQAVEDGILEWAFSSSPYGGPYVFDKQPGALARTIGQSVSVAFNYVGPFSPDGQWPVTALRARTVKDDGTYSNWRYWLHVPYANPAQLSYGAGIYYSGGLAHIRFSNLAPNTVNEKVEAYNQIVSGTDVYSNYALRPGFDNVQVGEFTHSYHIVDFVGAVPDPYVRYFRNRIKAFGKYWYGRAQALGTSGPPQGFSVDPYEEDAP